MGLGRGRTITSEWKGSNPVTPSQIRWRGKEENREKEVERMGGVQVRGEDCRSAEQLGVVGRGRYVFMVREESRDRFERMCS